MCRACLRLLQSSVTTVGNVTGSTHIVSACDGPATKDAISVLCTLCLSLRPSTMTNETIPQTPTENFLHDHLRLCPILTTGWFRSSDGRERYSEDRKYIVLSDFLSLSLSLSLSPLLYLPQVLQKGVYLMIIFCCCLYFFAAAIFFIILLPKHNCTDKELEPLAKIKKPFLQILNFQ